MESYIQTEDMPEVAKFLGMGFYRVKENGEFLEANARARELFGIPQEEPDLSKHSIANLYIFPAERALRIDKLKENGDKPVSSTLSLRVNNENRLLFDQCWYDRCEGKDTSIVGLVANISDWIVFPRMFEEFPMGVFELDDDGRIVYFNKNLWKMLGYSKGEEKDLLYKNIQDFYANPGDIEWFIRDVIEKGHAHGVLKFKDAKNNIIELECFSSNISKFKKASWGMLHDVTKRERYYRALDHMPTGYYYIEYDERGEHKYREKIVQCNEQFARIYGVKNKELLIGRDVTPYHVSKEEREEYFSRLDEADKEGEPVLNYPFSIKRADTGDISYIEIDAHLIKENGKVIGREGTIRDISEKVELEARIKHTENRLNEMTTDINNLIHTFLHPVLKFSGHAELFHQLGKILFKSIRQKSPDKTNIQQLGEELQSKLTDVHRGLKYISDGSESAAVLAPKFEKIINVFDYNLDKAKRSKILMDKAIRDAALCILEELDIFGFFNETINKERFREILTDEFISYLQNILFDYLIRTANILQGETLVMRREVEALRRYIGFGTKRIYHFRMGNLGKLMEENIEVFKHILAQRDITIEYEPVDYFLAMISEHDIDRVICNLLHNAAKYSHDGPGRVVKIKTRDLYQENAVEFSITSYGIPIKKNELESGDIFKFGYRGQFAYQADRDGTGVGLADAKDVVDQHQGKITITSEPVKDDGDPPKYKVPYITTVTIRLPKNRSRDEKKDGNQ